MVKGIFAEKILGLASLPGNLRWSIWDNLSQGQSKRPRSVAVLREEVLAGRCGGRRERASGPNAVMASLWPWGTGSSSGLTCLAWTLAGASVVQGAARLPVQQPCLPAGLQWAHVVSRGAWERLRSMDTAGQKRESSQHAVHSGQCSPEVELVSAIPCCASLA